MTVSAILSDTDNAVTQGLNRSAIEAAAGRLDLPRGGRVAADVATVVKGTLQLAPAMKVHYGR